MIVLKPDLNPTISQIIINCHTSCFLNTVTTSIFLSTNTKSTTSANIPTGASRITATISYTKVITINTTSTPETVTGTNVKNTTSIPKKPSSTSYTTTFRATLASNTVTTISNKNDLEKEVVDTKERNNIESFSTLCEYNCDRPISWIATASTTNTLLATNNERNSDSEERNEPSSKNHKSTSGNILPEKNKCYY